MPTLIPQRDLRNQNSQIIARVMDGETFVVTRDGTPVADLRPHLPDERPAMIRRAAGVRLLRLGDQYAADWLDDIRRMDATLDDTIRDPWGRDNHG